MNPLESQVYTLTLDDDSEKIVDLASCLDLTHIAVINGVVYWKDESGKHTINDVYDIENESHKTDTWFCGLLRRTFPESPYFR